MQKRLISGIQPTGEMHIGNYLGAIKQWVEYQNDYDAFFFIADYHALTTRPKPEEFRQQCLNTVAMLLALGVDPKGSTLFVQSQLPQHLELAWILNNFVTLGQLQRMTQFKEKSARHGQTTSLLTYPVLMAADILLYRAEVVPVGEDQVQHLELTREIVRTFNAHAGFETFVEPKPLLNKTARVMALNDPTKKMSKSVVGSAIGLLDSEDKIALTIRKAVTDSDPNAAKLSSALTNLFGILEGFGAPETVARFQQLHHDGQLKYSELKEQLFEDITGFLRPVQQAYHQLIKNEDQLLKVLAEGKSKAEPIAAKTLAQAKENLGLLV